MSTETRDLVLSVAEYIAHHAENDSRFLYPAHLRARRVEVTGLMEFMCDEAGIDVAEVNAHLDRVGK